MLEEVHGIIIHVKEYREHDALLKVLCEDGKLLSISAKGVQKMNSKNAPAVQLFTLARFHVDVRPSSTMYSLRRAEIIKSYRKIREDLMKQSVASYFCECIYRSDFDSDMYPILIQSMDVLEKTEKPLQILCLFQSIMNRLHGIEPYVDGCVRCMSPHLIQGISYRDGGFACTKCLHAEDQIKTKEQLKMFRLLCKADIKHAGLIEKLDFTTEVFEDLYQFFEEYSGISLKSAKFLKSLFLLENQ